MKINKMPISFLNPATLCVNFLVGHSSITVATAVVGAGTEAIVLLGNAL